jgi:hypothetical protein
MERSGPQGPGAKLRAPQTRQRRRNERLIPAKSLKVPMKVLICELQIWRWALP